MTRTERRAADRRGTAPTGVRRALDAVLAHRTLDPDVPAGDSQLPHRTARLVPPPMV